MGLMYDPPQLRDNDGVVHHCYGTPTLEYRATLCEYDAKGREPNVIYTIEDLMVCRAPVTCLRCLRARELSRWRP